MKVPLSWLGEYIDVADLSVEELADKLTFSGVEVEGIESVGAVLDEFFVVGEVRECVVHPNSDHLHVCRVFDGTEEHQVVCGAPNARTGLKVAFAKVGAVVPNGGFKIKKAKLRGVESFGMLCSKRELNVSDEHEGIWELDGALVPGASLQELMPRPDTVLELEITWNRPDCLSMMGIAREFAALLGRPLKVPAVDFVEGVEPVESLAKVRVEAPEQCLRYTARVVTGLDPAATTPAFMQQCLERAGQRSLGLAVDVTNFVMLECGQPLHAFDSTRLTDRTIVVRCAAAGEKITTLDGVERALEPSMLVIADAKNPEAVAGIMGGAQSEIAEATGTVLIESALFSAPHVKWTATKLGLGSESSRRFERGVDPELADWASRRVVHLLVKYGGAGVKVAKGVIDVDNRPAPQEPVALSFARVNEVIGVEVPAERVVSILTSLGLSVVSRDEAGAVFKVPSWRLDLTRPADLIEEVARMFGLDAIPNRMPALAAVSTLSEQPFRVKSFARRTLLGMGLTEAMHYSFLSAQELDAFDGGNKKGRLVLPNPVSADYGVMRPSLLPQLVGSLGRNASRQVEACGLFELGRVFGMGSSGQPFEEERLSVGVMGPFGRTPVDGRRVVSNEEALLWLKGALENFAQLSGAGTLSFRAAEHPAMEPGFAAEVLLGKQVLGLIGAVSGAIRHKFRLTSAMVVAEVKLEPLLVKAGEPRALVPVPQYPTVKRDIALLAGPEVTHEQIVAAMRRNAPKELTAIELFDIFTAKTMQKGSRSLAYSLSFCSTERTLTDAEVNTAFSGIIRSLKEVAGVDVREG